jgi:transcriptional regulator with XRE-family HTH domain
MSIVLTDEQAKRNVAANLTRLLGEAGVSRRKVAEETGESHTAIADYAKGAKMPGAGPLARLAEFFSVSTDFLLSSPKTSGKRAS